MFPKLIENVLEILVSAFASLSFNICKNRLQFNAVFVKFDCNSVVFVTVSEWEYSNI